MVGIQKEYNAKALRLFYRDTAICIKPILDAYLQKIKFFAEKIHEQISPGYSGACWGYNFDWEARAFFSPRTCPRWLLLLLSLMDC